jgi:uncharacterized protein
MPRTTNAEPVPPAQRIAALDVLRGVAICGILLMNIFSMGGVQEFPITSWPPRPNLEWLSWGVQTLFVQGAMRGLFTLLFGASMLLMLRRAEAGEVAPVDAWARRSLGLMAFGVAQFALFLWPGEILWNYGVSGLFLLAFRTARPRTLLCAAGLLIAGLSINAAHWTGQQVTQLQQGTAAASAGSADSNLSPDLRAAIKAEQAERAAAHPSREELRQEISRRTHLGTLLHWSASYWAEQNLTFTGWVDIAESLSFMLVGMALFRLGVLTGEASAGTYRLMLLVGYGGGLAWRGFAVWLNIRSGLDMGAAGVSVNTWVWSQAMFEPARLLVTLGHVGLVLTLFRSGLLGRAPTLTALGRMTLTVYCLQSILGSALFYGFGYLGAFGLPGLWAIAAGIWVATGLFCRWWFAHHAMGPAEKLLRWVAYGTEILPRRGRGTSHRLVEG